MKDLCIQIHPHRSATLDLPGVRVLCEGLARDPALVRHFAMHDGEDEHRYVNLMFETPDVRALWDTLEEQVYRDDRLGEPMRNASMAFCQGERGWDDYLLLHHYDPAQALDRFDGD